jgi:lipopolysaccharide transport system permease protein
MFPEGSVNSSPSPSAPPVEWVIAPDVQMGAKRRVEEVWRYRRIFWFFAVKAIQRLYAKTKLGPLWLVIRPLAPIATGSLVFSQVMKIPSDGLPYFLYFLTGSTIWNFFDNPLIFATRGLEVNRQLLTKLYLPRMILPASQMGGGLMEPVMCVAMLIVSLGYYRYTRGIWYSALEPRLFAVVPAVALALGLAFAISLWTSVWQARARDMRFILMYGLGFWYLFTPVMYPASYLPPAARAIAMLNPMTGPVEAFKWAIFGLGTFPGTSLAISAGITLVLLAGGLWYFTTAEGQVIDRL